MWLNSLGFDSRVRQTGAFCIEFTCSLSLCLCRFPLDVLVSSHSPKHAVWFIRVTEIFVCMFPAEDW